MWSHVLGDWVSQIGCLTYIVAISFNSILCFLGNPILMVYKSSGKILTLPVSPISSQSPILMYVLTYHLKVEDHSKDACTCWTRSSGSQDALAFFCSLSVISAAVKMKVPRSLRVPAMDSYTERLSGTPVKSPAVASAAWLGVPYHQ